MLVSTGTPPSSQNDTPKTFDDKVKTWGWGGASTWLSSPPPSSHLPAPPPLLSKDEEVGGELEQRSLLLLEGNEELQTVNAPQPDLKVTAADAFEGWVKGRDLEE